MTEIIIDESKLKELLKTVLFELMQEEKAMFSKLLSDIIEEIAMSNAIKESENTEIVSQEEIFKILEK